MYKKKKNNGSEPTSREPTHHLVVVLPFMGM